MSKKRVLGIVAMISVMAVLVVVLLCLLLWHRDADQKEPPNDKVQSGEVTVNPDEGNSVQPEQPGQSEKPEQPGEPEQSEKPEQPGKPGQSEEPEQPKEPGTPEGDSVIELPFVPAE